MEEHALRQPELVGREQELGKLKQSLQNALEGKGSTIFIAGEAGIGKTRLMDAFKDTASSMNISVLAGAADVNSPRPFQVLSKALGSIMEKPLFEEHELNRFVKIFAVNTAGLLVAQASSEKEELDADIFAGMLSAVQDFVRDSFGQEGKPASLGRLEYGDMKILMEHGQHLFLTTVIRGGEHPDMKGAMRRTLQALEEKSGAILESWTGKMSEIAPIQKEIDRLAEAGFMVRKYLEGVKLENERIRIADEVLEALKSASFEKPMAVFLEDLHWADESSLFVINYLARNIRKSQILLMGTLRPGESDALQKTIDNMKGEEILGEMLMEKLDVVNTKTLIEKTFAPNDFPDNLAERLYEQSKGNPLFVVEMLRGMHGDGSIAMQGGRYSLVSETYQIPATVEDVVNHRLDALDPDSMAMAEYASCIGQTFDQTLAASNRMMKDPDASLEKLLGSGILLRKNGAMEFSHAVFQSAIYNGIGDRWKSGHHKSIGEHLESAHADRLDDVIYDLARHFSRTREYDKSSDYCIRAGEKAEGTFAVEQALMFYDEALKALSNLHMVQAHERVLNILERVGDIQTLTGEYDKAIENFEKTGESTGDDETKARMSRKIGGVHENRGETHKSLEALAMAKKFITDYNSAEYARVLLGEGRQHWRMGEYHKAMPLFREAIKLFEESGAEKKDMGNALRAIGNIYKDKGEYELAFEYYDKSLAVMEEIGEQYGVAAVINNIGILHCNRGELDMALEYFGRSLGIEKKMGDWQGIASSLNNIGILHCNRGELDMALEYHERSLKMRKKMGDKWGIAYSLNNIGNVHAYRGELDMALEYHERSLKMREKMGDWQGIASSLNNISEVYHSRGELDKALESYGRSLEINEKIGDKSGIAISLTNIGSVYHSRGELDKALESYGRGLDLSQEIGERRLSIRLRCGLAKVNLGLGNFQEALENAEKALAISSEIGAKPEEGLSRRDLGMVHREMKEWDKADEEFGKAREILEEAGEKVELATYHYEHALLWKAKGEPAKARECLETALSEFDRIGMKLWAGKCREALDGL